MQHFKRKTACLEALHLNWPIAGMVCRGKKEGKRKVGGVGRFKLPSSVTFNSSKLKKVENEGRNRHMNEVMALVPPLRSSTTRKPVGSKEELSSLCTA